MNTTIRPILIVHYVSLTQVMVQKQTRGIYYFNESEQVLERKIVKSSKTCIQKVALELKVCEGPS